MNILAATVAVGCVLAAAVGPLRPRLGAPIAAIFVVVVLAVSAGRSAAAPLSSLCAYLVPALASALVRERRLRLRLQEASVLEERTRIAGEVHDVIAHHMTVVLVQLRAARSLLTDSPDVARAAAMLDAAATVAHDAVREAQGVVGTLRGRGPGWPELRTLVDDFAAVSQIACELQVPVDEPALDPRTSQIVYRTVQEALTNVLRHSAAESVHITIEVSADHVIATVTDRSTDTRQPTNSRAASQLGSGHGLHGLRERAEAAGGMLRATPVPHGFMVTLTLPRESP
jgi:signal transduction histidine kinase